MRAKTGLIVVVTLLSVGLAAVNAADLQAGDSVSVPTTAAEHAAAAAEYEAEAKQALEKAAMHRWMGSRYRKQKASILSTAPMAHHCQKLADSYKEVAFEAATLAKLHREGAKSAGD